MGVAQSEAKADARDMSGLEQQMAAKNRLQSEFDEKLRQLIELRQRLQNTRKSNEDLFAAIQQTKSETEPAVE